MVKVNIIAAYELILIYKKGDTNILYLYRLFSVAAKFTRVQKTLLALKSLSPRCYRPSYY